VLNLNGKSFLAFSGITFVGAPGGSLGAIYGSASHDLTFTRCTVVGPAASV
jgi:hypothetical protein